MQKLDKVVDISVYNINLTNRDFVIIKRTSEIIFWRIYS